MPYSPTRSFTARQEQVVDAIRRDLSNTQIAAELGISESTVQGHIDAIMYVLPNPDDLSDRQCIFQLAWWRVWHRSITAREAAMQQLEDEARQRALRKEA